MRQLLVASLVIVASGPAIAIEPYTPLPLKPAELVTPPDDFIADVGAFLAAIRSGDGDAIKAGMGAKVSAVDGALELKVRRTRHVVGPHEAVEDMLSELGNWIGGDVQEAAEGVDPRLPRIEAERQYIVAALSDDQQWGRDPMMGDAICSYAYRAYDRAGITALSEATGVSSSSFVYVDAPVELMAKPEKGSGVVGTLQTDLLYALDYDSPAPGRWIGVYLPDGSSGFVNFDEVELNKPYAAGICFEKNEAGRWVMVGQASTSL